MVLDTFVDLPGLTDILTQFVKQGWVETVSSEPVTYVLSKAGVDQHGVILVAQKGVRQRAVDGVSKEEYSTVIRVLRQIAENLEGADDLSA